MTTWGLYWALRMDTLREFAIVGSVFGAILGAVLCAIRAGARASKDPVASAIGDLLSPLGRLSIVAFCIALPFALFLPTTRDVALMWTLPRIVNDERVKELPDKILDLASQRLDELLATGREKGEGE